MSKRDEVFELFSKGRTLDAPCVQALGLKPESVKRYHRLWKQQNIKAAPVADEKALTIGSLEQGAMFEHAGRTFSKGATLDGGSIEGYEVVTQERLVFRPGTFILPK